MVEYQGLVLLNHRRVLRSLAVRGIPLPFVSGPSTIAAPARPVDALVPEAVTTPLAPRLPLPYAPHPLADEPDIVDGPTARGRGQGATDGTREARG